MYDSIIVGAGPAGATAAYHLGKQGYSVLILEKAIFPRHKPCGGGVSPMVAQWFDFDFAPVIDNKITQIQYSWKMGDPIQANLKMAEPMWIVRRDTFDYFIVQQAVRQGAQLQTRTDVQGIKFDNNHWQVITDKGSFFGRYLIAADGVTGPMAKWLGFPQGKQFLGAALETKETVSPEKLHRVYFDFGSLKNGYIWNFPKRDGYSISAGFFRGGNRKSTELKKQVLDYASQFGANLDKSQYREYSMNLWSEHQSLHTTQALLIGEAAAIVDPLTGEGIRPAIFTGMKAAEAVSQTLSGDGEALNRYTQIIREEWGKNLLLAQRLAGLFYQFPQIAYKIGVKRPAAAQIMGKILSGELSYGDVTEQAINALKRSLLPGRKN